MMSDSAQDDVRRWMEGFRDIEAKAEMMALELHAAGHSTAARYAAGIRSRAGTAGRALATSLAAAEALADE